MAVLPVRIAGDPVLREKARKVKKIDASVQQLIDDMIETMYDAPGVGMAAPQVGVPLRVVVIGVPGEEIITLVNPEIVKRSGQRRVEEGCLSVPGYKAEITRSETVTAKGLNREGKMVRIKGEGLLAQALEHETDHVNGILYVDHLESPDQLVKLGPEGGPEQGEVDAAL
jgi:peptide deformylase